MVAMAVSIALLGGVRDAAAERIGVILVGTAEAPVMPPLLENALVAAIRQRGATPVVEVRRAALRAVAAGAIERDRLAAFRRAEQLGEAGWRSYLSVEGERGALELEGALAIAERVLDLPGGAALYADLALRLGAVRAHLGQVEAAAAAMRLSHRLDPHRGVPVEEFSPDVAQAFAEAQARQPVSHPVRLTAAAPQATIAIDGQAPQRAPATVVLEEGRHVAVARAPGHAPRALSFEVTEATPALVIELEEDRLRAALAQPWTQPATTTGRPGTLATRGPERLAVSRAAADAAMVFAELDELVFAASVWRSGEPALLGQRCEAAPVRCTAVVELRFGRASALPAAAVELLARLTMLEPGAATLLAADRRVLEAEPRPAIARGVNRGCRWCRNRWVWIGGGLATAAAVAGVLIWARDERERPVIRVDPCDFGSC